jgi:hypothetical protein
VKQEPEPDPFVEEPLGALLVFAFLVGVAVLLLDKYVPFVLALVLGVPSGAAVWLLAMFGWSKGWITFDD